MVSKSHYEKIEFENDFIINETYTKYVLSVQSIIIINQVQGAAVFINHRTTTVELTVYMCSNKPFHPPRYCNDFWTFRIMLNTMM